jgi:hypothetical protein
MVDRTVVMTGRQRDDWLAARALLDEAVRGGDLRQAKRAKVVIECLKLIHEGEHGAWGLDAPLDMDALTDAQIKALAEGRRPPR